MSTGIIEDTQKAAVSNIQPTGRTRPNKAFNVALEGILNKSKPGDNSGKMSKESSIWGLVYSDEGGYSPLQPSLITPLKSIELNQMATNFGDSVFKERKLLPAHFLVTES